MTVGLGVLALGIALILAQLVTLGVLLAVVGIVLVATGR